MATGSPSPPRPPLENDVSTFLIWLSGFTACQAVVLGLDGQLAACLALVVVALCCGWNGQRTFAARALGDDKP